MTAPGKAPNEFAPPPEPARGRSYLLAAAAHVLLFAGLGLVTRWTTESTELSAQAELWAAVPQEAAPRLQTPEPAPPAPAPGVAETAPAPPAAPAPAPRPQVQPPPEAQERQAEIALKQRQERERQQALAREKAEKAEKAERQRKEKLEREKAEKALAQKRQAQEEKAARERQARENKARQEREKRQADAEKRQREQAQAQAEAQGAEALRQENLRRMQGLANATGGETASGNAERAAGPSASYAGRLVARIRPNISYPGDMAGNPRAEVEVRTAADGTILSRRIVSPSGNKAWDDAVLRAIDKTEILPRDTDGRVPPLIVLGFRPLD